MNAERKKILDMLAEGKITAEEADKLLDKLAGAAPPEAREAKPTDGTAPKPRFLRIVVDRPGQEQVNVRMPLAFARTRSHLLAALPPRVTEKLAELGIDFSAAGSMNDKEWASAMEDINIDIEKGNGKKVKVFCE
jgi:hypothetical protein